MKINAREYIKNIIMFKKQLAIDASAIGSLFLVLIFIRVNVDMLASVIIPLSCVVLALEVHSQNRRVIKNQIDELLLILHATMINLHSKMTTYNSIKSALGMININSVKHRSIEHSIVFIVFNSIVNELKFHDIGNAIDSIINRSMKSSNDQMPIFLLTALSDIANDYRVNQDIFISIKNAYRRVQVMKTNMQNKRMNYIRKFFTLGIVLTTVVPSIMLFGFIAYSMIFYSYSEFMMFSILLIGIFPCAYMILEMQISST